MLINGEMRFRAYRQDAVEMVAKALEIYGALGALCADPSIEVIVRPGGAARAVQPALEPGTPGDRSAQSDGEREPARAPGWSRELVTVSAEDVIPAPAQTAQNGTGGRPLAVAAGRRPWSQIAKAERSQAIDAHGAALTVQMGHGLAMSEWDAHRPADSPAAGSLPKTYASSWAELRDRWIQAAAAAAS